MKTVAKGRRRAGTAPIAVVYSDDSTGPADGDDTGALVALLHGNTRWNFQVVTVGPNGTMSVREALATPGVQLYAQPGADGDDSSAYKNQKGDKAAIREFVKRGGRYLGICMGGFLAERGRFNIFHGRVDEYYSSRGASVTSAHPAVITVTWRGTPRQLYFQDGGYMVPKRSAGDVTVLARYTNNTIAAIVASFGSGKVGLSGPHPEAPREWYRDGDLPYPGPTQDLGDDLVNTLMAP
ncbi:MAG TPA: BPL-N domain-containing protein [Actinophytocola sp.]|nr:BPL-N domain-containing protein [Actinophytocola sp.]